jgi:hypothetical protein
VLPGQGGSAFPGRECGVGRLYDCVTEIDRVIASRGLDAMRTKGEISLKAGFFIAIIFPDTPDDPAKLQQLTQAAREVLGITLNA